jgi:peptide/nickel transport system permease protein
MTKYIGRRLGQILPTLWIIYTVLFGLTHLMPGDPVCVVYGENCQRLDDETRAGIRAELGLDDPLPVRYAEFLWKIVRLDFGYSYVQKESVAEIIAYRLPRTFRLMIGGMVVAVGLGIPLGMLSAFNYRRLSDSLLMAIVLAALSMPIFWQAFLAQLLFTQSKYGVDWFPVAGYGDGNLWYLVLPSIVLGIHPAAVIARIMRSSLVEVQNEDYIRTARAKGLPAWLVALRHQTRNALLPTMTIVGLQVGGLMTGALLVEIIFNYPGLGRALSEAILRRDTPVIMGILTYGALVLIVVNLLVDLLYVLVDPRIRYED